MVSKRAVLAGLGGCTLLGAGGGLAWSRSVGTGRLFRKSISVVAERDGDRYEFDVANLWYSASSQEVGGSVVEEFADIYEPPATLRVSSEIHDRLTAQFTEVAYYFVFEANGRIGGRVPRGDFNRVSLGDEAEILAYDWLVFGSDNHVVTVTEHDPAVTGRDINTTPLADAFPN